MTNGPVTYKGMTLFTTAGERKYLSATERERFLAALNVLQRPEERTFCEMLHWTGCRPSEALALTALNIDIEDGTVVVCTLKKRGGHRGRQFRAIPAPRAYIERLDAVHGLSRARVRPDGGRDARLWTFSRTTAWKRTQTVMRAAGITGARACAKGLRHGYGVHAALASVPETRIKKWLGHESLATTEIYLDMAGPEDRAMAARMWPCGLGAG